MQTGAPLTEFILESVIRDGLGELRATPTRVDDIFSRFLEAHFSNQYGQSKIDEIKTYIQNNQIKITHAYSMIPTVVPCISIQIIQSQEREDFQNLGNAFLDEDTDIASPIRVPIVTPGTYDASTGKLTVTNAADLSLVCPGLVFEDNSGNEFTILGGNSNTSGNKFINIGLNKSPDLGGDGLIKSNIKVRRSEFRMVRLTETVRLGVHGKDNIHLAKFLYIILMYILKSRQESLINRGVHLDHSDVSVFDREDQFQGENIFSRYFNMGCYTQFVWNQGDVNLIDCFDTTVKAGDPGPADEDTVVVNPTDDC